MSRRLLYQVAMSADGYIAAPNGEHDWITMDPSIDFMAQCSQFDTAIMGRATFAKAMAMHGDAALPGLDTIVFSRTLAPGASGGARIVAEDARIAVLGMKTMAGRDIWLFGGARLAGQLLEAGLIDGIDIAIMPVVLGQGTRLFDTAVPASFRTVDQRVLAKSGIVVLRYALADRLNGIPGSTTSAAATAIRGQSRKPGRRQGS